MCVTDSISTEDQTSKYDDHIMETQVKQESVI